MSSWRTASIARIAALRATIRSQGRGGPTIPVPRRAMSARSNIRATRSRASLLVRAVSLEIVEERVAMQHVERVEASVHRAGARFLKRRFWKDGLGGHPRLIWVIFA